MEIAGSNPSILELSLSIKNTYTSEIIKLPRLVGPFFWDLSREFFYLYLAACRSLSQSTGSGAVN